MPKPEHEFFPVTDVPFTPIDDRVPGLTERILARESESEAVSRILRFEPGTDTSPLGVQEHPFWEEVYILEGYLHDLTLDQKFPAGTFACRPPGMRHGPWKTPDGCVTFEVRYTTGRLHLNCQVGRGGCGGSDHRGRRGSASWRCCRALGRCGAG